MARGTPHSDETRAAVLAALLAGQSVSAVAAQFKLDRANVIRWRDAAGLQGAHVQQQKQADIGALVITYLQEALTTLAAQQTFFRDTPWLRAQDAAHLAVLHGITADKAFRIIGALETEPAGEGAAAAAGDEGVDPAE